MTLIETEKLRTNEVLDLYDIGASPPAGHVPKRMHAWTVRQETFGEPAESFRREVVDVPVPGAGEVLVEIMAAGVNYNGVWAARGKPVDVIALRHRRGEKESFQICGTDGSGIVRRLGANVTGLAEGDEVVVHGGQWDAGCPSVVAGGDPVNSPTYRVWGYESNWGSFGQFAVVQAHQCLPKPEHLSWEEAACHLVSSGAAYRMLHHWRENAVRPGDVVLVWGGAGGLGCMAIQLVRAAGALPVAVVSSPDRAVFCDGLGAIGSIDRRDFDHWGPLPSFDDDAAYEAWLWGRTKPGKSGAVAFRRAIWKLVGKHHNPRIVFEHPGQDTVPTSIFVCDTGGMVVICAGTSGYGASLDLRYLWMQQKRFQGSHAASDDDLRSCNDLVRERKLDPCLSRTFPWAGLPQAHQLMAGNGHPPGNMAVLINAAAPSLGVRSR
jgi:crotonyl-CoA carboxylase/reductase